MDEIRSNDALNISLAQLSKKKITIDNDPDRVIYLDVADMNMIVRLKEKIDDLTKLQETAVKELTDKENEDFDKIADKLKEIDNTMRETIDYIFDGEVSEVCAPNGNMFDFINGKSRYEIIFDALVQLYGDNISAETKKLEKRVNNNKHTQKYVKK